MVTNPISDRIKAAELPKIGDVYGYNASCAGADAQLAARRYEYALEQRDKLNERIRFGGLTLNAAALLGLASFVGDEKKLLAFGISNTVLGVSALFFGAGIIAGCLAIWTNANHYVELAGSAFKFRTDARHKFALFEAKIGEASENAVSEALAQPVDPLPDFSYSIATIWLTNFSGAFWLTGFGVVFTALACKIL